MLDGSYSIKKGVVFKCSSRGFRGSRGVQLKKPNNPLPKQPPSSTLVGDALGNPTHPLTWRTFRKILVFFCSGAGELRRRRASRWPGGGGCQFVLKIEGGLLVGGSIFFCSGPKFPRSLPSFAMIHEIGSREKQTHSSEFSH